ncbi:hypothetical protein AYO20_08883 [Fonsecaea nubica]|uniref:Uncharacterized protein n=1 Tax=Fonsecaea nubica TaxID=856822 RepID=A0A178CKY2_9EURO|nr:hypothetical protein AYO20_08883 [Fonsecaea nubica]OAL30167.1 hypothetical protein AYO20_08883 [Fonsecaea nubica]
MSRTKYAITNGCGHIRSLTSRHCGENHDDNPGSTTVCFEDTNDSTTETASVTVDGFYHTTLGMLAHERPNGKEEFCSIVATAVSAHHHQIRAHTYACLSDAQFDKSCMLEVMQTAAAGTDDDSATATTTTTPRCTHDAGLFPFDVVDETASAVLPRTFLFWVGQLPN